MIGLGFLPRRMKQIWITGEELRLTGNTLYGLSFAEVDALNAKVSEGRTAISGLMVGDSPVIVRW